MILTTLEISTFVIIAVAWAGIHTHVYLAVQKLSSSLTAHDKERAEFIIEKAISAAKNAGALSRRCSKCDRVVHKYDLFADSTVVCHDCKVK